MSYLIHESRTATDTSGTSLPQFVIICYNVNRRQLRWRLCTYVSGVERSARCRLLQCMHTCSCTCYMCCIPHLHTTHILHYALFYCALCNKMNMAKRWNLSRCQSYTARHICILQTSNTLHSANYPATQLSSYFTFLTY